MLPVPSPASKLRVVLSTTITVRLTPGAGSPYSFVVSCKLTELSAVPISTEPGTLKDFSTPLGPEIEKLSISYGVSSTVPAIYKALFSGGVMVSVPSQPLPKFSLGP